MMKKIWILFVVSILANCITVSTAIHTLKTESDKTERAGCVDNRGARAAYLDCRKNIALEILRSRLNFLKNSSGVSQGESKIISELSNLNPAKDYKRGVALASHMLLNSKDQASKNEAGEELVKFLDPYILSELDKEFDQYMIKDKRGNP